MKKNRILVVDDEESICEILKFNLEVEGYDVDTAFSAEQALKLSLKDYSLILLDVMMGEMSGFKMAHSMKKNPDTANIPIIFCTAKDSEDDTITGLNIGADDYIAKPFSVREVVARIKSVLRRSKSGMNEYEYVVYEDLVLDMGRKKCFIKEKEIFLTKKEFEMLLLFMQNINKVFSREDILHLVWSDEVIVLDRTIDVNITRLRKKIGNYGKHITTRQGYGYGFEE